jgi:hypothetical protein
LKPAAVINPPLMHLYIVPGTGGTIGVGIFAGDCGEHSWRQVLARLLAAYRAAVPDAPTHYCIVHVRAQPCPLVELRVDGSSVAVLRRGRAAAAPLRAACHAARAEMRPGGYLLTAPDRAMPARSAIAHGPPADVVHAHILLIGLAMLFDMNIFGP